MAGEELTIAATIWDRRAVFSYLLGCRASLQPGDDVDDGWGRASI